MELNRSLIDYEYKDSEKISSEFNNIKNENLRIQIIAETKNDSLFSIYVKNNSKDTLYVITQDSNLSLIQEAKDKNGNWKPIEYSRSFSSCGNSYYCEKIANNRIIKTESKKYYGKFKTEIRFKLLDHNEVFYSNQITCYIDPKQFKTNKQFRLSYAYKIISRVSDKKLAEKVLFLEPNAMHEFLEKNKNWIAWITEQNRKRNEKNKKN